MNHRPNAKLRICRYWALGPKCPNVDAYGIDVCPFAHWNTGHMASPLEQRGTCLDFSRHGFCNKKEGCFFEHRHTGVTGLYQGALELSGFELEVATAAMKSGFNTLDQPALFDLIWSMKQVAARAVRPQQNQKPRPLHEIYPDRYRPSGIGDNTMKKRGHTAVQRKADDGKPPKFYPIPPLMRKRHADDGTEDNPIKIDYDDEQQQGVEPSQNSNFKRQKTNNTGAPQSKIQDPVRQTQSKMVPGINNKPTNLVRSSTKPPLRESFLGSGPFLPSNRRDSATAQITKQLRLVRLKLQDAKNDMNNCQATMKRMFEQHRARFDHDAIMAIFQNVANCMNKVYDGGRDGIVEVERAVAWLDGEKNSETIKRE